MAPEIPWLLFPLFFLVAAIYSSVGHGGASGYLALFALAGVASSVAIPGALVLNILVASIGFVNYRRSGYSSFPLLLPFVVTSVPAAYIGGRLEVADEVVRVVLGTALLLAAARLILLRMVTPAPAEPMPHGRILPAALIGLVLGFLSGMIGIGGGIFLSPLLLLLGWADVKRTAAVSSGFIVLNSVGGLLGHLGRGAEVGVAVLALAGVVALGGFVGSRLGASRLPARQLQVVLGVVLLVASWKLLGQGGS